MSIPSRVDAATIVRGLRPNDGLLRHSTAVAEVAAFVCAAMTRRDVAVDRQLVESAALLHDLDKMLDDDDPLKELGHGAAGAEWLRRSGYAELAPAVASHPVMVIGDAPSYDAWATAAGLAGRIVTYADKRARQDVLTLEERFAGWRRRHPDSPRLDVAYERARTLEREICEQAGIEPHDLGRLQWVTEALSAAD